MTDDDGGYALHSWVDESMHVDGDNEFRRLFDAIAVGAIIDRERIVKWSIWRRKHQSTARQHHYHRSSEACDLDLRL